MNPADIRAETWAVWDIIKDAGPGAAQAWAPRLRAALATHGLDARCHEGRKDLNPDETAEWYAGQFLGIVDSEAWFAMNSWVNCADKFLGPRPVKP